jgi:hypothetical protein
VTHQPWRYAARASVQTKKQAPLGLFCCALSAS